MTELLRSLMPGESDMAARMRGMDWSGTDLGEPALWPANLRGAVSICLSSRLPIFIGWGPRFSLVYNDGCILLLGPARHPRALGLPAREGFPDLWERIGPLLDRVQASGQGQEPELVVMEQGVNLYCSPILADGGDAVQGVFCHCTLRVNDSEVVRATETQFRRYFDLGLVGMALTSPAKGCLEANAELCRMLGYSREELLRAAWTDLTHPDDLAADVAQFDRVMAGEIDGYVMDKRWIRKDGQVVYSTMAANCLRDADGSVLYFVALVQDMTAREAVEEALRHSEANLAHGQRISQTGSWSWDAASGDSFYSQETRRIFGLEAAQQMDYPVFLRMLHPDDVDPVARTLEHAVATASPYDMEYRIVRQDGSTGHVVTQAQPVLDAAGQLRGFVGTAMDVSERRQAEEQVRESERRFRQLVESIPHHVWSVRTGPGRDLASFSLGYWNQRLIDYTGLTPEELRSGGWAALHPADVAEATSRWGKALAEGSEYQMEERMLGRDGCYRRFVCRAVPVHDGAGQPVEWFGTNTDVEDRARSEEALRQLQADLARVTRATTLGGLAASIAHEVNQPLAAIAASAGASLHWLAATPPNVAEAVSAASQIVRDATRAGDIILRIRKFVQRRAEASEDLDLAAIVAEVAGMVQTELQMRKTVLRVIAPAGLPAVRGDRVQLQQVVLNLLVNAMEAMADLDESQRHVEIDIHPAGAADIVVAVKDNGVGLPAAEGERIFEAFVTTKPTGTGMGLTISRGIIEAHEGRLWASSNQGPGATVSFRLPVAAAKTGP
jgi:PAS domain S-box-containing protein